MSRTLATIALLGLLAGCTRYSMTPGSPFARKPDAPTTAPVPNNSPLALGTPAPPTYPGNDDTPVVPGRPPEAVRLAGEGVAASIPTSGYNYGVAPDGSLPSGRPRPDSGEVQTPRPIPPPSVVLQTSGTSVAATTGPSREAINIAEVKKLATFAAQNWAKTDTYEAVVTRRELTPAKEMNTEVVLYQYRKEPMSVYIKNIGESGKGRELIYNQKEDKIHVILGEGDVKFLRAGFRAPPMSPDDPRVKEKSRYSIREAGLGTPIGKIGSWVAKAESGKIPADSLAYIGPVERKEFSSPVLGISLKLRPGDDPMLPAGGTRQWFIDPRRDSQSYGWPVLIIAADPAGKEVEYYLFEKLKLNLRFTDADFSPERLGKK